MNGYAHMRSLSNGYQTTADHNTGYHMQYDSGLGDMYCTPRENGGGIDTDGRLSAEFDSGRGRHKPKRHESGSSEFVLSGKSNVVPGVGPPHKHAHLRQSRSFMPPSSSYRTHSDQRHPRQELIAPNIMRASQPSQHYSREGEITRQYSGPYYVGAGAGSVLSRYHDDDVGGGDVSHVYEPSRQGRKMERGVPEGHDRKRSVSPQMTRRHRYIEPAPVNDVVHQPITTSHPQREYVYSERNPPLDLTTMRVTSSPPQSMSYRTKSIPKISRVNPQHFRRKKIDMSIQSNREDTFINHAPVWPGLLPHLLLVLSGFYYTGQEDIVKCFACLVELSDWTSEYGHNVHKRHFLASPNCPHLRKEYLKIVINEICPDEFNYYSDFGHRYKSFNYWPIPGHVSGKRLAEAGFFYNQRDILTQCYCCGVIKGDWRSGDDPFMSHFQLCSSCPHIKEQIGAKKIYKVEYKSIEDRLKSFKNMPTEVPVDKEDIAGAGFVMVCPSPFTVQCPDCHVLIDEWCKGDDPIQKHFQSSEKDCSFLKNFLQARNQSQGAAAKPQYSTVDQPSKFISATSDDEDDEGLVSSIQYPPSYKSLHSTSSNESISLPSQSSIEKQEELTEMIRNSAFRRSVSTPSESSSDNEQLCIVCYENNKDCAIVPCGHLCVCKVCADRLEYCPICRHPKQDILKIFIP